MKRFRSRLAAFVLFCGSAGAQAAEGWPASVQQALRTAGIPPASAAAVVQQVDSRKPSLQVNETVAMNPASVMKLVTTLAGLEVLGPNYRWRTNAYLDGVLREGVLQGSLILKGTGDPKLSFESFWLLLRALRDRGLREVRGDLVLDRSYFATGEHDPSRAEPRTDPAHPQGRQAAGGAAAWIDRGIDAAGRRHVVDER